MGKRTARDRRKEDRERRVLDERALSQLSQKVKDKDQRESRTQREVLRGPVDQKRPGTDQRRGSVY